MNPLSLMSLAVQKANVWMVHVGGLGSAVNPTVLTSRRPNVSFPSGYSFGAATAMERLVTTSPPSTGPASQTRRRLRLTRSF